MNRILVLTLAAMTLAGCSDNSADSTATQNTEAVAATAPAAQSSDQAVTDQVMAAITDRSDLPVKGAHDAYDPHAALSSDKLMKVALQFQEEGRTAEALATLADAIHEFPSDPQLHFVNSQIMAGLGQTAEALSSMEMALRLDPENPTFLVNRAQFYRDFGRVDEALIDLDKALAVDPDFIAAYFNRGALRYGMGDFEGALADFDTCVAIDPHEPAPYFNRAAAQQELGNNDEAIADLERFISRSTNEAWTEMANQLIADWKKPITE